MKQKTNNTMQTKFRNLIEFMQVFSNDYICREYFEKQRWNGKPVCPHCQNDKNNYTLGKEGQYKCSNKECYKKFTVTVGTVFEGRKAPLHKWFAAMYLIVAHKKGISSLQLSSDIGVTQKTAWFMLMRIREMLTEKNPQALNNLVESDESFFGGKESNKHSNKKTKGTQGGSGKAVVLGLLERGGDIKVTPIENREGTTLLPIIAEQVTKGATIATDELRAYSQLSKDYTHITVNHSANEYVSGMAHVNGVEGFWSLMKRGINGIQHSVSKKHLHRYCDEYAYRYNNRNIADTERFVTAMLHTEGRLTYKQLIRK
ncbi:MAG: IS1595 family transposase [Bacteroidia bacterium]